MDARDKGVYIKIQGKDRKAKGKSREMKVRVTYEGWKKEGKKRFNKCLSLHKKSLHLSVTI